MMLLLIKALMADGRSLLQLHCSACNTYITAPPVAMLLVQSSPVPRTQQMPQASCFSAASVLPICSMGRINTFQGDCVGYNQVLQEKHLALREGAVRIFGNG